MANIIEGRIFRIWFTTLQDFSNVGKKEVTFYCYVIADSVRHALRKAEEAFPDHEADSVYEMDRFTYQPGESSKRDKILL